MTAKRRKNQATPPGVKGRLARVQRGRPPSRLPRYEGASGFTLNKNLSWPKDDMSTFVLRTTISYSSATPTGILIIGLGPQTIATPGYTSLGDVFPLALNLGKSYAKFMISKASVVATLVTPITNGGYIALGYEPDDTDTSNPPISLSDAATCVHSDMAQVGEPAAIMLNPSLYYNDWRSCDTKTGGATTLAQAGVVQVYANAGITATTAYLIEYEVVMHFAGFRKIG